MFSYSFLCTATIAARLPLFSLRPPSNSCCSWLDDLLTLGIWWSPSTESHLIESPSNGNNFKPTSQIIRHFSRRTWFWNKPSSQQTHLYPATLEMLQGSGGTTGAEGSLVRQLRFMFWNIFWELANMQLCKCSHSEVRDTISYTISMFIVAAPCRLNGALTLSFRCVSLYTCSVYRSVSMQLNPCKTGLWFDSSPHE